MVCKLIVAFAILAVAVGQQFDNAVDYFDYPDVAAAPAPAPVRPAPRQQAQPQPTPTPILKQINRHNEDGSYTYGYESADGSFKIETKHPNGDVKGKYGYVDDLGKVRVVEYGADRLGFQPAGEGITVAPPTLVDETTHPDYEDINAPRPRPSKGRRPRPQIQPQFQDDFQVAQPAPRPVRPAPRPAPRPARPVPRPARPAQRPVGPSQGPLPHRPQFANAAPIPANRRRPAPRPSPQQFQQPRPAHRFQQARPAPQPRPQQSFPSPQASLPRARPVQQASGGLLDQLASQYALPDNAGIPLHDISFGYY